MKIQKPLPGMTLEETERLLQIILSSTFQFSATTNATGISDGGCDYFLQ